MNQGRRKRIEKGEIRRIGKEVVVKGRERGHERQEKLEEKKPVKRKGSKINSVQE